MALARCNSFDEGVCDCWCFTDAGDESEDFYVKRFKIDQKGNRNDQHEDKKNQKGAKVSQGTVKNTTCGTEKKGKQMKESIQNAQGGCLESFEETGHEKEPPPAEKNMHCLTKLEIFEDFESHLGSRWILKRSPN